MDSDYYSWLRLGNVMYNESGLVPLFLTLFILLLLGASAFISVSEAAFFSLTSGDLSAMKEHKHRSDATALKLLDNSELLLATIHVVNIFLTVCIVILSMVLFSSLFDFSQAFAFGFFIEVVSITFLLLLFGEITSKVFARAEPVKAARITAPVLNVLKTILYPVSYFLLRSSNFTNRVFIQKKDISVDDLSKALEMNSNEISEEKEMLEGIIKFYDRTAVEIMTSRLDVADLDIKTEYKEVLAYVLEVGYSRIPVYDDSHDQIKGVLYTKDLFPFVEESDTFCWQNLIRPAYFVPETKKIGDLLEEFRTNKTHLAIVVDEFGGTSGIVTLEDVLEEIVGEISDEYDEDERLYVKLSDESYIFEAKISLPDFFRITHIDEFDFEEVTTDVDTLAGLILELKGDFPAEKETVSYRQYRFRVLELNKQRIVKIKFFIDTAEADNT